MQRAVLFGARLYRAVFIDAHLHDADFRNAHVEEVDFRNARMDGVDFLGARIERSNFRAVDLSKVRNMTQDHVNLSFGTSLTELPPGLTRPCHWSNRSIVGLEEDVEFNKWLHNGAIPILVSPGGGCP